MPHFFGSVISQKGHILVTKILAGSKLRILRNVKKLVPHDLQGRGSLGRKNRIFLPILEIWKNGEKSILELFSPLTPFMVKF